MWPQGEEKCLGAGIDTSTALTTAHTCKIDPPLSVSELATAPQFRVAFGAIGRDASRVVITDTEGKATDAVVLRPQDEDRRYYIQQVRFDALIETIAVYAEDGRELARNNPDKRAQRDMQNLEGYK